MLNLLMSLRGLTVAVSRLCIALIPALLGGCVDGFPPELATDPSALLFNREASAPLAPSEQVPAYFLRQAVFDAIPAKQGSHGAAVTSLADGELLAAWYSYDGPHELTGSAIYMSRLPAGGDAWLEPWVHIDRPEGDGNPVLYSEKDRVWLFQAVLPGLWSTAHIESQVSEDAGRSWSHPRVLPGPIGANVRFPPVRTVDGHLLLPAYDDLFQRSLFYASADGLTWNLLGAVSAAPPGIQPAIARSTGKGLVCVMRNEGGGWLWVMASQDGGASWSAPQDSGFANPGSPAAIHRLMNGHLLLVFNDSSAARTDFTAAISVDSGVSWPYRRALADPQEKCSYPAVTQSPDGTIHVLFSVGRERIDHIACNEAWVLVGDPAAGDAILSDE